MESLLSIFVMYYYLHELKSYDIRIIGLDSKTDVIRKTTSWRRSISMIS
ncbi:MAG: hypothetical protein ACLU80_11445 [Dorea sp.]